MVCFSKIFNIALHNLHGNSSLAFSQLSLRRTFTKKGLQILIQKGLITATSTEHGFVYAINNNGINIVNSIESEYKNEYIILAEKIYKNFHHKNDIELQQLVSKKSIKLEGGIL
ncbi:hypothetical protein KMP11_06975 [Gemella sp. zg-570]|nr:MULTISPECIES: ABC-three component system middle component 2 [unclassified Gemella]MBU0278739.1 hypothetical protein [Gemella sp. zg-1178]QWQ38680.1 hypothetical protein KMP11_06975 [Gemella sp. zg-570]